MVGLFLANNLDCGLLLFFPNGHEVRAIAFLLGHQSPKGAADDLKNGVVSIWRSLNNHIGHRV